MHKESDKKMCGEKLCSVIYVAYGFIAEGGEDRLCCPVTTDLPRHLLDCGRAID